MDIWLLAKCTAADILTIEDLGLELPEALKICE